jgi:GWxTD domain-containing protein
MLAETYFSATFWKYGVDELGQVLARDPDNHFARWRRGKAYLERAIEEWQDKWFKRAGAELRLVDSSDPIYPQACRDLALCCLDLGHPDSSIHYLEALDADSMDIQGLLIMGIAACRSGDMPKSDEAFSEALARMDDERRERFLSMDLIVAPGERGQLSGMVSEDARSVLEQLWKSHDPNPATVVNERLIEHLSRVAFADFHFSVPRLGKIGSRTARGEVYIRYGGPLLWHFDPFGTGVFTDETALPDPASFDPARSLGDRVPPADQSGQYRDRRLRASKPRWVWQYRDFSLNFDDTFLNGDYDFPYELDWSAYTYAYLEKKVPEIYETQIKRRMKVVLDALNLIDDSGRHALKLVYACDTRGIAVRSPFEWPQGSFEVEIAVLDSLREDVARAAFVKEIRADSSVLYQTQYPLISTLTVEVPPGKALTAISITSTANGAAGFTSRPVSIRAFGDTLELSDIEMRFAPAGPPNPTYTYLRRGTAFLAFSVYNSGADVDGIARLRIAYRLSRREKVQPAYRRFLDMFAGDEKPLLDGSVTSLQSEHEIRTLGPRADEVIGIDLSALAVGHYDVAIHATDLTNGATARLETRLIIASELDL